MKPLHANTAALLLALWASVASAQSAAPAAAAASGPSLTRDELRTCLDNEPKFTVRRAELDKRADALKVEGQEIQTEGETLKAEQKRVEDSAMPGVRERFERRTKAYSARVQNGNKNLAALRQDYETLQKDMDTHNANCSGRPFKSEDKEAILKEREGRK